MQAQAAQAVRTEFEMRLKLIEAELERTAEDLGRAQREVAVQTQAAAAAATAAAAAATTAAPLTIDAIRAHPAFAAELQREVEMVTMRLRLAELEERQSHPQAQAPGQSQSQSQGQGQGQMRGPSSGEWLVERENLERRLRDAQTEAAALRAANTTVPSLSLLQV